MLCEHCVEPVPLVRLARNLVIDHDVEPSVLLTIEQTNGILPVRWITIREERLDMLGKLGDCSAAPNKSAVAKDSLTDIRGFNIFEEHRCKL